MNKLFITRGGAYSAPRVELLDITVEKGFAGSILVDYGSEGEAGSDPTDTNYGEF